MMQKLIFGLALALGGFVLLGGNASAESSEPKTTNSPKQEQPKVHEVQPGEYLAMIAEAEKLESWRPLWDANPEIQHPDLIYAGQKLTVPQGPVEERPLPASAVSQPVQQYSSAPKPAKRNVGAANYAQGAGGLMARIRQRESGGNYAINTGNGYYGAYQFSLGTWRGVGGSGLPSDASPAEQDMRAQMLFDRRGCNPWPNTCY